MQRVLVVGCGNASRRDDGAGLYVIRGLAARFGLAPQPEEEDGFAEARGQVEGAAGPVCLEMRFTQQFDLVLADELKEVDLFIAVDAHTGACPEALRRVEVSPGYSSSLTSHHLTPDTLAGISLALHGKAPRTVVFSVRGYDFNFGTDLTPQTQAAADQAIEEIATLVCGGE